MHDAGDTELEGHVIDLCPLPSPRGHGMERRRTGALEESVIVWFVQTKSLPVLREGWDREGTCLNSEATKPE